MDTVGGLKSQGQGHTVRQTPTSKELFFYFSQLQIEITICEVTRTGLIAVDFGRVSTASGKSGKIGRHFSSQGKIREFGIFLKKIREF